MKHLAVLLVMIVAKVAGDVSLSHGMHQVGAVQFSQHLSALGVLLGSILSNGWVDGGMVLELTFFLLYLVALSWLDLSYLLPMTAVNYLLTALIAYLVLHEQVDPWRWLGTLAIAAGVALVGLGEYRQHRLKQIKK